MGVGLKNSVYVLDSFCNGFPTAGRGEYKELLCQSGCVDCSACSACPTLSTLAGKMLGLEFSKTGKCKSRIKEEIKTQRKAFYKDRQAFSAAFLSTMCLCVFAGQMIVQSLHY